MSRRLAACALCAIGCAVDQTSLDTTCTTTAECPMAPVSETDQVCDAMVGRCVDEPVNGLLGSFRCRLAAPTSENPGSDVTGTIGSERYVMSFGARCQIWSNGRIRLMVRDARSDVELGILLDPAQAAESGRIAIGPSAGYGLYPSSGEVYQLTTDGVTRNLAYSTSGFVYLRDPLAEGRLSSGFLDVAVAPVTFAGVDWGRDCTSGGVLVCGDAPHAECAQSTGGGKYCTSTCSDASECGPGIACQYQYCRKTCATNDDCPVGLTCDTSTAQGGCW
jgi:hypothetical protein